MKCINAGSHGHQGTGSSKYTRVNTPLLNVHDFNQFCSRDKHTNIICF